MRTEGSYMQDVPVGFTLKGVCGGAHTRLSRTPCPPSCPPSINTWLCLECYTHKCGALAQQTTQIPEGTLVPWILSPFYEREN